MDEYSRYEIDHAIAQEDTATEIRVANRYWISWAGPPGKVRTDMSGPHMSQGFADWVESFGGKLELIPARAHHRLGLLERNHQVRREQLAIYGKTFPDDPLRLALRVTQNQRNALRNVRGFSPTSLVLGSAPRVPGGLADEDFRLSEHTALLDPASAQYKDQERRVAAGRAFLEANASKAVRTVLLSRSRPPRRVLEVGEWVYYWRQDSKDEALDKVFWHGPGLVVAIEAHEHLSTGSHSNPVVWVAHGAALYRTIAEQLRPELPMEQQARERQPDMRDPRNAVQRARDALQGIRGPVRYNDLTAEGVPEYPDDDHTDVLPPPPPPAPPSARPPPKQAPAPPAEEETSAPSGSQGFAAASSSQPDEQPRAAGGADAPKHKLWSKTGGSTTLPGSPSTPGRRSREEIEQLAQDAVDVAREEDGLPPSAKRIRQVDPYDVPVPDAGEALLVVEIDEDIEDVLLVRLARDTVSESKLTPEEKLKFDAAKDEALQVFIRAGGFQAVPASQADPEESAPMRYLLKWKEKNGEWVAGARVLWQGFKKERRAHAEA